MARPPTTVAQKISAIPLDMEKLSKLYKAGWTDDQVAEFLGIATVTLHLWKKDGKFFKPLKEWKAEADVKVEKSLYERACGYRTTFKKNFVVSDGPTVGSHVEIHEEELVFPPDPTSCIFWLKNRQPENWKDKREVDHNFNVSLAARLEKARQRCETVPVPAIK